MSMQSKIVVAPEPLELMRRLEAAGEECWVVGGCVRDSLRGVRPADWDMTTSAAPERMLQIFAGEHLITAGLRHGTVGVVRQGRVYEITTYRVESGTLDHRHPDQLFFTKDVQDDLARRDFTVNAMAYHPQRGLLDCFGGEQDLQKGIIRCVGQPALRFTEDALRILRALRFVAVLGFSLEEQTVLAAQQKAELLQNISAERIWSELQKLLEAPFAPKALSICPAVWRQLFPELQWGREVFLKDLPSDASLRLIWLYCQQEQNPQPAFLRLRTSRQEQQRAAALWALWQRKPKSAVQLRYALRDFGLQRVEEYRLLCDIDPAEWQRAKQGCWELRQLSIGGQQLIELGCPKGKAVGELLGQLLSLCIEGKLENTSCALQLEARRRIKAQFSKG